MNVDTARRILGVSENSNIQEIKNSFRKKSKILHPDINKSKNSESAFKELNAAYQILRSIPHRKEFIRSSHNSSVVNLYEIGKPTIEDGIRIFYFQIDKKHFISGCNVKVWTISSLETPLGVLNIPSNSPHRMEFRDYKKNIKIILDSIKDVDR